MSWGITLVPAEPEALGSVFSQLHVALFPLVNLQGHAGVLLLQTLLQIFHCAVWGRFVWNLQAHNLQIPICFAHTEKPFPDPAWMDFLTTHVWKQLYCVLDSRPCCYEQVLQNLIRLAVIAFSSTMIGFP